MPRLTRSLARLFHEHNVEDRKYMNIEMLLMLIDYLVRYAKRLYESTPFFMLPLSMLPVPILLLLLLSKLILLTRNAVS